MTHTVALPERTFELLQAYQVPLLDEPDAVIERALRSCLARTKVVTSTPYPATLERGIEYRFDAGSPPPLRYSIVVEAQIGERRAHCWNELHRSAHALALSGPSALQLEELQALTGASLVRGRVSDRGFYHLVAVDASIQGVNSMTAWRHALQIAQWMGLPIAVRFRWELTRRARYPGVVGSMAFLPSVA